MSNKTEESIFFILLQLFVYLGLMAGGVYFFATGQITEGILVMIFLKLWGIELFLRDNKQ